MSAEPIIATDMPIIDAHHHLWCLTDEFLESVAAQNTIMGRKLLPMYRRQARYLFDEYLNDLKSGHNIVATVYVDAHSMYRTRGPDELKSLGEVEFVNGVAAMAESGVFGKVRMCAGIVGAVDLRLGDRVEDILRAHMQAGGGRYRGIRSPGIVYDEDATILGADVGKPHVMLDNKFRVGFKWLRRLGLSFDAWILEPQLPDLINLARTFQDTQIVLNHVGAPVGVGPYAGQRQTRFSVWRERIRTLAKCDNVAVKLGGLGIPFGGFDSYLAVPPANSQTLCAEWKPYIEACIEAFGVNRCMFESNFPVDSATCSYATLWNAFKRTVADASVAEKNALFNGTATRIYRLDI
jgi:predicted TIM-barrel fold metal-dependent hydrolase